MDNKLSTVTENATLTNLKDYYKNQIAQTDNKNSAKLINPNQGLPDWEKTLVSIQEVQFITPIGITKSKENKNITTNKYLVINNDNGKMNGYFYYFMVENKKNTQSFNLEQVFEKLNSLENKTTELKNKGISFVKTSIEGSKSSNKISLHGGEESGNFINYKTNSISKAKGTDSTVVNNLMNIPACTAGGGTVVTIDWYFQTYLNGVLISEVYLYSTTECWGAGGGSGGGGTAPTTATIIANIKSLIEDPSNVRSADGGGTNNYIAQEERSRNYKWFIYYVPPIPLLGSSSITFWSLERGTQRFTGGSLGIWYWYDLQHLNIYKLGNTTLLNVNLSSVTATAELNTGSNQKYAKMNLFFQVDYSFVFEAVSSGESFSASTSKVWDITTGYPVPTSGPY